VNPYEILGISSHATGAQIKSAYRKLVKKFHPDVYKGDHSGMIRELNEAYDILSDPVRKAAYDARGKQATSFTYVYEEDPRTKQRREYVAHRRAAARRRRQEHLSLVNATYKLLRYISFATLIFASLVIIDKQLPQYLYYEIAERGWDSRADDFSYISTKHFTIAVPRDIHVGYDYKAENKQVLTIAISPILRIPSTVSLMKDGEMYTADVLRTIFQFLSSSLFG
jgi:curved DNA-binding protein CbpA